MSIWVLITVALVSWWLGFIVAGILASAKLTDELFRTQEQKEKEK